LAIAPSVVYGAHLTKSPPYQTLSCCPKRVHSCE
jgi:hypothetical protein